MERTLYYRKRDLNGKKGGNKGGGQFQGKNQRNTMMPYKNSSSVLKGRAGVERGLKGGNARENTKEGVSISEPHVLGQIGAEVKGVAANGRRF